MNAEQTQEFIWRMALPQRWQAIKRVARKKFSPEDFAEVEAIKAMVDRTQKDRNIVVHGVVGALVMGPPDGIGYGQRVTTVSPIVRVASWTIYMGEDAGKNFPVSAEAVEVIYDNARLIVERLTAFNLKLGFTEGTPHSQTVESDWPKPL